MFQNLWRILKSWLRHAHFVICVTLKKINICIDTSSILCYMCYSEKYKGVLTQVQPFVLCVTLKNKHLYWHKFNPQSQCVRHHWTHNEYRFAQDDIFTGKKLWFFLMILSSPDEIITHATVRKAIKQTGLPSMWLHCAWKRQMSVWTNGRFH